MQKPIARVLLVESYFDLGSLMRATLTRSHLDTTLVNSGEDALECLAEDDFDLLLVDTSLPGMSGLELCRLVREERRLRSLPIMLVSGDADPELKEEARRLGAVDIIVKPFQTLPFLASVLGHLRLQPRVAPTPPHRVPFLAV